MDKSLLFQKIVSFSKSWISFYKMNVLSFASAFIPSIILHFYALFIVYNWLRRYTLSLPWFQHFLIVSESL